MDQKDSTKGQSPEPQAILDKGVTSENRKGRWQEFTRPQKDVVSVTAWGQLLPILLWMSHLSSPGPSLHTYTLQLRDLHWEFWVLGHKDPKIADIPGWELNAAPLLVNASCSSGKGSRVLYVGTGSSRNTWKARWLFYSRKCIFKPKSILLLSHKTWVVMQEHFWVSLTGNNHQLTLVFSGACERKVLYNVWVWALDSGCVVPM